MGARELSTIDTALLLGGVLDCQQYFDAADPTRTEIRALADSIYRRVDWDLVRNGSPAIRMGWKPTGRASPASASGCGYNEAMIIYMLALGSPTHPVPASAWSDVDQRLQLADASTASRM